MFNERDTHGPVRRRGSIEVVCGSMFSGKTEELIRRMKRAQFARQKVEIFKPAIDVRYSEQDVVSHDHNSIPSTPVDSSQNILLLDAQGHQYHPYWSSRHLVLPEHAVRSRAQDDRGRTACSHCQ